MIGAVTPPHVTSPIWGPPPLCKQALRPKLEYVTSAGNPHYKCDICRLEGVQRAAARFCKTYNHYTPCVSIMLDSLGLEPIETRRKLSGQCMMYKTIHGHVGLNTHNYLQFSEETRTWNSHAYTFQTPFSSKNALKFSFFPGISREWDQLPAKVVLSLHR